MDNPGKRILIVDDSPENCELLGEILSMNGYEFVSARDGFEALERLRASAFDLIISDVLMPRMDGFQLCRKVKTDEILKAIPIVFYTGHYTDAKDEELLRSLGAALYLLKPVKPEKLLESIRQVLERSGEEKIPAPMRVLNEDDFSAAHVSRITIKLSHQIEELERERTNLQAIFDAAPIGMLLIDEKGEVTRVNQVTSQLVDRDAADMLSRQPGDGLCCIHAASVAEGCGHAEACSQCPIRKTFSTALRTGEAVRGVEAVTRLIIHGEEQNFYFSISASPIVLNGKNHVLLAISDITERKRMEEALRESEKRYRDLSIIDDLTLLYNSRFFYFQLKIESDRSNRYGQPLTLLLLDLDNFKYFNDTYGHVEGDQVLQRLGQVVKRCLRETDFAYRYGGEEFTILLPMTASEDGAVTAERIRTEFKKETFAPMPGQDVHVTVSIGLAQYKAQEEMKVFVHRVDQLMYQGKKNGKDRVCCES